MAVTAGQVSELRKITGAGMMDCKKALEKTDGDLDKAQKLLREEGKASAGKKAGRIAAEGKVLFAIDANGKKGAIVEVNCETDFVGRGDDFNNFAQSVADAALTSGTNDLEKFMTSAYPNGVDMSIEEARKELIAKIGENITIRRVQYIETADSLTGYTHSGRIGVLVDFHGADEAFGKDIAMHIAASQPTVVNPSDVPADLVEKEREIYTAQASKTGKPADVIEKMVAGRMKKFVNEVSLLGQSFVKDPSMTVEQVLNQQSAKVNQFFRFEVGEGIEKQEVNFAEEVAAQIQGS